MTYRNIEGWFFWRDMQEEAAKLFPENARFLEIGIYLGRGICSLGEVVKEANKRQLAIGVDTCRGTGVENDYDHHVKAVSEGGGTFAGQLHKNIVECGLADTVTVIVSDSVTASKLFADGSLDWVHLDAAHDYESVKRDIECWQPKVKIGGWLSGDDYIPSIWPGVVAAVNELLPTAQKYSFNQWRYIK